MRDLGYDSHNAILGMGEAGFAIVLHALMFILFFAMCNPLYKNQNVGKNSYFKSFYRDYKRRAIFNDVLTVGIECSIEIFICCYYNLAHPIKILSGDIFSLFFSYYCILLESVTIMLLIWIIT